MRRFVRRLASAALVMIFAGFAHAQGAILSKADWDTAFAAKYGDGSDLNKLLGQNGFYDDTDTVFAWQGTYWVRAFVAMAETFDDPSYLDKAVKLIDYMLRYRDDARAARGEINILAEPYYKAPMFYINNPDQVMPAWRMVVSDGTRRSMVLHAGQITKGIMRFVYLVYDNPKYEAYQAEAEEYLARVIETVDAWTETYIFNRQFSVPGSYYWPIDGTRLSSNPVPYNQEAGMGITLLLLDDVLGGGTEYARMGAGLVDYWLNYVRLEPNNSYTWDYAPYDGNTCSRAVCKIEDTGHGHIDVGFLLLADRYGIGDITAEDMARLANTWIENIYLGNGSLAFYVDGSGVLDTARSYHAGSDWIDLAEFDPTVLDIVIEIYDEHVPKPTWTRPFLGWAEILRWTHTPDPEPAPEPDPEPTPEPAPEPKSLPILINSGANTSYVDALGRVWEADRNYVGKDRTVDRGDISIAKTKNDRIYQTERYCVSGYKFPVSDGEYTVKLHFAETYDGAEPYVGRRVFDVNVEGDILQNLDVYAEVGFAAALVVNFQAQVSDGELNINFASDGRCGIIMINGIEILPAGGGGTGSEPAPEPAPEPDPTDTTAPEINILSPSEGQVVATLDSVSILAYITDDNAVSRVDIFLDGTLAAMMHSDGPFLIISLVARLTNNERKNHQIVVNAIDKFGNASSTERNFSVR